jgi:hypothetical protein
MSFVKIYVYTVYTTKDRLPYLQEYDEFMCNYGFDE